MLECYLVLVDAIGFCWVLLGLHGCSLGVVECYVVVLGGCGCVLDAILVLYDAGYLGVGSYFGCCWLLMDAIWMSLSAVEC